jgi:hypothetical protein
MIGVPMGDDPSFLDDRHPTVNGHRPRGFGGRDGTAVMGKAVLDLKRG